MSSLFGSPIVGAVIIIEASGLGRRDPSCHSAARTVGRRCRLPRLHRHGVLDGSELERLRHSTLSLPKYHTPTLSAFGWTILLAAVVAVVIFVIARIGLWSTRRRYAVRSLLSRLAALTVGALAIVFGHLSGKPEDLVLFSGQDTMGAVVNQAATFSQKAFALVPDIQGPGVQRVAGQRSWRAHLSGHVPRHRCGAAVRPPSGILRGACGSGTDGSSHSLDPPTSLGLDHHRHGRLTSRGLHDTPDHRGGRRRLSGGPGLVGLRAPRTSLGRDCGCRERRRHGASPTVATDEIHQ